jgi:hypothetical protein
MFGKKICEQPSAARSLERLLRSPVEEMQMGRYLELIGGMI